VIGSGCCSRSGLSGPPNKSGGGIDKFGECYWSSVEGSSVCSMYRTSPIND
jgi:hypothetical protein